MAKVNGVDLQPVAYMTADGLAKIYQTDDGKFRCWAEDHLDQPAGSTIDEAMSELQRKHGSAKKIRESRVLAGKEFPGQTKLGFEPK